MHACNYSAGSHTYAAPPGYPSNASYGAVPGCASNEPYTSTSGCATSPAPAPAPVSVPSHALPVPTTPALGPVQVPPGCYPIELVQFWRGEHKRGQPHPLHWALFVRTAPSPHAHGGGASGRASRHRPATTTPRGNVYELVGTPDTYTAQFLSQVTFEPDTLPDWRGAHVIGWVHPGQLTVFETVARQVPVWRHRPDWRCQHWVYEVVRTVGGNYPGVLMDGVTLGGLQRHMGRLLDAWESGDI